AVEDAAVALRLLGLTPSMYRAPRPATVRNRSGPAEDYSEALRNLSAEELATVCRCLTDSPPDDENMMRYHAERADIPVAISFDVDPPSGWRSSLRRVLKPVMPALLTAMPALLIAGYLLLFGNIHQPRTAEQRDVPEWRLTFERWQKEQQRQ